MRLLARRRATLKAAGGGGGGASPAAFPSRLVVSGRRLVDENGYVMPTLRGFNIHTAAWSQSAYNAMAALDTRTTPGAAGSARFIRMVIKWDDIQPTNATSVDTSLMTPWLDPSISRAIAAGFYVQLEIHLNTGDVPAWATGADETAKFCTLDQGKFLTQYLAKRYGDPTDPLGAGQYSKGVIGLGLNEPPVNSTTMNSAAGSVPYLENHQATVFGWMREFAPNWIGFMAYSYGSGTPLYEGPGEDTGKTDANPAHAVYNNAVIDVHDYMTRVDTEVSTATGRQPNGGIYTVGNGGPARGPGDDPSYVSTAIHKQQHLNFLKPYKDFSVANNIPVAMLEWGWTPIQNVYSTSPGSPTTGEVDFITDKMIAWNDMSPVAEAQWLYAESTGDQWAAKPAGTWRPSTLAWFEAHNTGGSGGQGGTTFISDTFTAGTAGELLTVHSPGTGGVWNVLTDRTGHKLSAAGRMYGERPNGALDDAMSYNAATPASADYDVQADVVQLTAASAVGVMGRIDTAARTGYAAFYDAGSGLYKLEKIINGSYTNLGTYAAAAGTVMLRMRGTTISLLVNGTSRISVTDSSITSAGRAGTWSYSISTATTGVHLDNFLAVNT